MPDIPTDAELDAMQAYCDAAPDGPWVIDNGDDEMCSSIAGVAQESVIDDFTSCHRGRGDFPENMPWIAVSPGCSAVVVNEDAFEFIAQSRTDLPRVIAACRELRRELDAACRNNAELSERLGETEGVLKAIGWQGGVDAVVSGFREQNERLRRELAELRAKVANGEAGTATAAARRQ